MIERQHPRLKEYDYRTPGAYFITICCENRQPWLAVIDRSGHRLSGYGELVRREILRLPDRYPYVEVPKFVVMPNHLHLILVMKDNGNDRLSVPQLIGVFKAKSTQACKIAGYPNKKLYQTSFYDHVIRTEQDYSEIGEYIDTNPSKWVEDRFFV